MMLTNQSRVLGFVLSLSGLPLFGDSLWLGTLTRFSTGFQDVLQTDLTGNLLSQISNPKPSPPITGIATDGTSLYFGDSFGFITKRALDGSSVLGSSFLIGPDGTEEDLAWDSTRSSLWRISHSNYLQQIDPISQTATLSTTLSGLGSLGALGLAYDNRRDLLYVSFCFTDRDCSSGGGVVDILSPTTHTIIGTLFQQDSFTPGGLAYDPVTDSLWVSGLFQARNVSRTGNILGSISQPAQDGFVVGLEFIDAPVENPEPTSLVLVGAGLLVLFLRKTRSNAAR